MMFYNIPDDVLEAEFKRRKKAKKKDPLWVRQPAWWRIVDYVGGYFLAWMAILYSPLWFPFWFAYKMHKYDQKMRKERAEEQGYDWRKYHV
jgi:hypothetical protein